jgi:type II secretory pathway pseudopilin PulG
MAAFFLLLAVLVGVVLVDALLENTGVATATLFDRSFDQLSTGELMLVFAGLGFLLAMFLFLSFGASRTRRTHRKEKREARRGLKTRVDELERENARLRQQHLDHRAEPVAANQQTAAATADNRPGAFDDRPEAYDRSAGVDDRPPPVDDRTAGFDDRPAHNRPASPGGPEPLSVRRERLDDRTEPPAPTRRDGGATRLGDDDTRRS